MLTLVLLFCAADPHELFEAEIKAAGAQLLEGMMKEAEAIEKLDAYEAEKIRSEAKAFLTSSALPDSPRLRALRDRYVGRRAVSRAKLLAALPEEERAAREELWSKEDAIAPPPLRRKWVVPGGWSFAVIHGQDWGEYDTNGRVAFRWKETDRTGEYVELVSKRPTASYTIRLYAGESYIAVKPNHWEAACGGVPGKWAD